MVSTSSPQHLAVGEVQNSQKNAPNDIKKQSYASTILAKQSAPSNLELYPVVVNKGVPVIQFTKDEVNNLIKEEGLHQAVVLKFSYGRPELSEVRRIFSSQFDVQGHCNIGHLEYRHLLVRFDLYNDYVQFLSKSTAFLKSKRDEYFFRTFPWSLEFNPKEETPMAVVWISLPGLPPNFFAKRSLMSIASAVGKPLAVDKATNDRSRPSAARVKVIINLLDNHPSKIKLQIIDSITGKTVEFDQQIAFDNLPKYCTYCKHQGHDIKRCRIKKQNGVAEVRTEAHLEGDLVCLEVGKIDKLQGDARDFLNAKRSAQTVKEVQGKVDNAGDVLKNISKQDDQAAQGVKLVSEVVQNDNIVHSVLAVKDRVETSDVLELNPKVDCAESQVLTNQFDNPNLGSNGPMQISASAAQNDKEPVTVQNVINSQFVMALKDKEESDALELIPNVDDAEHQEVYIQNDLANLCSNSSFQISGSTGQFDQEQFNVLNDINIQSELDVKDKVESDVMDLNPNAFDAETLDVSKQFANSYQGSNVPMQNSCSAVQIDQECLVSNGQVMLVNERKKSENSSKERDLSKRESNAEIKKEKQPKRTTVSLKDINMSDFNLSLTHSSHEKGSSSEVKDDMFQHNSRRLGELVEARLMSGTISGKHQLTNSPASYSADASSHKSLADQINNFSRFKLTADHNSLGKPLENAVKKENIKVKASASSGSQSLNTVTLSNMVSNNSQEKTTIVDDKYCTTSSKNAASLLNQNKQIVEKNSISKSPVLFTGGRIQSVISYPIIPYTYIEHKDHEVFSIFDGQNTPSVIPNRKELIIKSKLWDQRQCKYEEGWEEGSTGSSSSEEDDDNSLAILFSQKKNANVIEFVKSTMGKIHNDKAAMHSFEEGEEEEMLMQCRKDAARKGDLSPMHSKTIKKAKEIKAGTAG